MSDSVQHKLSRVRPPRVQITYDVETGGALEKKEIPFIVGIIAPLSGKSKVAAPPMGEKKMVEIDRDNFNKICESINPGVAFEVPNTLSEEGGTMPVSVEFNHIDDFDPVAVLVQIEPLKQLYEERSRLRDFMAKLDGNGKLHSLLLDILTDDAKKDSIKAAVSGAQEAIVAARALDDKKESDAAILAAFADQLPEDGNTEIKTLVTKGDMILEESQTPYVLELIAEFVIQLVENSDLLPAADADEAVKNNINVGGIITRRIGQKDKKISRQLNHIIHHDDFQAMEASWRGLHFLVMNTETNTKLKLKLLNATYDELYKDLDKAVEFDQSALFRLIYEDEYGTYGGDPYSVLVGDFQLGRTAKDIQFLEMMSGVAASAHAPFIASAWAKLFDLDDYANLYKPRDLSKIFESAELIQWRAFREKEDSRYVTLTLPKVMLRIPYHHENNPVDGIYFDEDMAVNLFKIDEETQEEELDANGNPIIVTELDEDGITYEKTRKQVDARKVLWGNPAYILAQRITNAFSLHGWTAAIRGVEGGGLVEGLPVYTFETEDGDIALTCPTQVSITDRREKELNDLGFMAICHCKGTNKAAFFGGQSTNKPKMFLTDSATVNAQISSMLPYVMAASRFAHYIKVIMREKIGSFMTRQNVHDYLNTWIAQYVLLDDSAPQHIKAKFPLREANIVVTDIPGKVGAYRATVFLRPHFQLEELSTSIRLVAELPS
ncbi:type VI secretion system contractile sheath large subunit [Aliikangiella sp. IMCC44359]|uniref:type VI secretion system contractile sheath large subunit n=1 Tax=Aliikangiella sp. IMCC44359 TaxID=3459125 RepID=UPI00403AC5E5